MNSVILAHRGIATLGHGRVPKSDLFAEIFATLQEAKTSVGVADFLLLGELESSTLTHDIDSFSLEFRRAVRTLKSSSKGGQKAIQGGSAKRRVKAIQDLRKYFDEFSGPRRAGGGRKSIANCSTAISFGLSGTRFIVRPRH